MPHAASPLYYRIQEMVRSQIVSGRLAVGARVPSESELAEKFETTRATVRQALAHLTFEGLIVRRMGSGTFVAKPRIEGTLAAERPGSFEDQMEQAGARVGFCLLSFEPEPAPAAVAAGLSIPAGTTIFRLRRLRLIDDEIVALEDRSMLERIGVEIPAAALARRSVVAMAEAALGTPLGGVSVSVGSEAARAEVARLLGLRSGRPVLVRSHAFFDRNGEAILIGDSTYRGDKYRFTYRFGRTSK